MKTEVRALVAEVAAQLKGLWVYGKDQDVHKNCAIMFASYMDILLNGTKAKKAEYVRLMRSLRDDLTGMLATQQMKVERSRGGWAICVNVPSQKGA